MAHYYFHLFNRIGFVRDEEGQELPSLEAAREAAIQAIRDIISEEAKQGIVHLGGRVDICDGADQVLESVPFHNAVELQMERTQA